MRLSHMTDNLVGQPMFRLKRRIRELELQGKKVLHFEIGDAIWDTPSYIIESAIKSIRQGETHYTASSGIVELKEAIANFTNREYGFRPDIKQILIIPANAVIDFAIRCLCDQDAEVIIPDPSFPTYASVLNYMRIKAVTYPLKEENGFKTKATDIKERITSKTKLIIINSPSNPTGTMIDNKEITEIYNLAFNQDIFLLTDEVYSRMLYRIGYFSPSWFDRCKERVILLKSFSKVYSMTGFRLGYVIAPELLIEKMGLLFQTIFSCMPVFVQRAGITALEEKQQWVEDKAVVLKECRDLIVNELNDIKGIICNRPEGAFYVFPNIKKTGLTSEQFADLMLEKAGVALLPGNNFGSNGEGYIRMCYATKPEIIREGIGRIKRVLHA